MTASVAFNTCRLKITIISQDEIKHRVCCYRRLFLATHKAAVTRKTRKQNFEKKCPANVSLSITPVKTTKNILRQNFSENVLNVSSRF